MAGMKARQVDQASGFLGGQTCCVFGSWELEEGITRGSKTHRGEAIKAGIQEASS
jgi:hypothetical protein